MEESSVNSISAKLAAGLASIEAPNYLSRGF
jgi:hypothetical protein